MRPNPSDRILVVGAGAAGIHLAHLLEKRGFTDVVLLEKSPRIGGKSKTVVRDGVPHELGTCYLHPGYTRLLALLEELGDNAPIKPGGPDGRRDLFTRLMPADEDGPPDLGDWILRMVERARFPRWLWWAPDLIQAANVLGAVRRYKVLHQELLGESPYAMPLEPSDETVKALDKTFLQWLRENKLEALVPLLLLSHSAQGYGLLETVPALYGLWWNDPVVLDAFVESSSNPDKPVLMMLEKGFQQVWETLAERGSFEILNPVEVLRIRRRDKIEMIVRTGGEKKVIQGDWLVLACDLSLAPELLGQDLADEEWALFSQIQTAGLTTTLVKAEAESEASCIAYWPDVLRVGMPGEVYSLRDSQACVDPEAEAARLTEWVCYQYQDHYDPKAAARLQWRLKTRLSEHGMRKVEVVEQNVWPYFSRFSQAALNDKAPWRLFDLQGRFRTWYVGGSACFESINDVMSYNEQLVAAHLDAVE